MRRFSREVDKSWTFHGGMLFVGVIALPCGICKINHLALGLDAI